MIPEWETLIEAVEENNLDGRVFVPTADDLEQIMFLAAVRYCWRIGILLLTDLWLADFFYLF